MRSSPRSTDPSLALTTDLIQAEEAVMTYVPQFGIMILPEF